MKIISRYKEVRESLPVKALIGVLVIINILVGALMLITGYSYTADPLESGQWAVSGLLFPLFFLLTLLFIIVWLFLKLRFVLVSIAFLLCCITPCKRYCPLSPLGAEDTESLRILSWNVHNFHSPSDNETDLRTLVLSYLERSDAQIALLQEAPLKEEDMAPFSKQFPYFMKHTKESGTTLSCLSCYPIVGVEVIEYESAGNCSACFYIKRGDDTLRVVNNHLESICFKRDQTERFASAVKGSIDDEEQRSELKEIFRTVLEGMKRRKPQADAVAAFVGDGAANTIVVGDFNDTPISYAHNALAEKLTDCYTERGFMPGFTFMRDRIDVRIDHIFCSPDFEPNRCWVDKTVSYSDHFPIAVMLGRSL